MLTVALISNASSGADYYTSGKYYINDKTALTVGGGIAKQFNIKNNDINLESLNNLLLGNAPNGQKLGTNQKIYTNNKDKELTAHDYKKLVSETERLENESKLIPLTNEEKKQLKDNKKLLPTLEAETKKLHRAGLDLTFSAPKNTSILAILGDDSKIKEAHDKAVLTAMDYVEKNIIGYREYNPETKGKKFIQGGKALYTVHRHYDSREQDPQLHSHVVLQNMILKDKNSMVSLDNRLIMKTQKLVGQLYRNEMAKSLKDLGYEIESKSADGTFDIKHKDISKDITEFFSQRHKQIEEDKIKNNAQNARDDAYSQRNTKKAKKLISEKELVDKAENRLKQSNLNISLSFFKKDFTNYNNSPIQSLEKACTSSITHLTERTSVFNKDELTKQILNRTVSNYTIKQVDDFVNQKIEDNKLISYKEDNYNLTHNLTTHEVKDLEDRAIEVMKKSKNSLKTILLKEQATIRVNKYHELNKGQKDFIIGVTTSKDQAIAVQGSAGVGKTYVTSKLKEVLEEQGYSILGLAPTNTAKDELSSSLGIEAKTISSFIGTYGNALSSRSHKHKFKKKVILVDESSFLGTQQTYNLLNISAKAGARIVFIGDSKQLTGVERGAGFRQLQENGIETIKINNIVRQSNKQLKQAIEHIRDGNIGTGLAKIEVSQLTSNELKDNYGNRAVSSVMDDKLAQRAVEKYNFLSGDKRKKEFQNIKNVIAVPTNKLKDLVNEKVREQKIKSKKLGKEGLQIKTLKAKNFTEEQARDINNYSNNQVIKFNKTLKVAGISAGDYGEVVTTDNEFIWLIVDNKTIKYKPTLAPDSISVYDKNKLELREKEQIIFKSNDKDIGITTNQKAIVKSFNYNKNNNEVVSTNLVMENTNKELTVDINSDILKHMDYSYAQTGHSLQGATVDNVISILPSYNNLSTNQSLYVHVSRGKHNAIIVTDDKESLQQTLIKPEQEKLNAQDLLKKKESYELTQNYVRSHIEETTRIVEVYQEEDPMDICLVDAINLIAEGKDIKIATDEDNKIIANDIMNDMLKTQGKEYAILPEEIPKNFKSSIFLCTKYDNFIKQGENIYVIKRHQDITCYTNNKYILEDKLKENSGLKELSLDTKYYESEQENKQDLSNQELSIKTPSKDISDDFTL